jgi:hypothetical protein
VDRWARALVSFSPRAIAVNPGTKIHAPYPFPPSPTARHRRSGTVHYGLAPHRNSTSYRALGRAAVTVVRQRQRHSCARACARTTPLVPGRLSRASTSATTELPQLAALWPSGAFAVVHSHHAAAHSHHAAMHTRSYPAQPETYTGTGECRSPACWESGLSHR